MKALLFILSLLFFAPTPPEKLDFFYSKTEQDIELAAGMPIRYCLVDDSTRTFMYTRALTRKEIYRPRFKDEIYLGKGYRVEN